MNFLEKNPNVLMDIIPNEVQNPTSKAEYNRQGVINFRNVTGISAPGRSKYQPMMKSDGVVAPWKVAKKPQKLNKDLKNHAKKRVQNNSSKRKTDVNTKATNHQTATHKPKSNKDKIKLYNNSRQGISSQPVARADVQLQSKTASRNETAKPNPMTAGGNMLHKIYQTPSFLSPNSSSNTEKIPSMTTFSNESTLKQANNGSSVLDRRTIIISDDATDRIINETDSEHYEDEEFHHNKSKSINIKNSMHKNSVKSKISTKSNNTKSVGTQLKEPSILKSNQRNMFNIETVDNLENTYNSQLMAKSDIVNRYSNLDKQYEDNDLAKTSYNHSRIGVRSVQAQGISTPIQSDLDNNIFKGEPYNVAQKTAQVDISSSHGSKTEDEIYLNKNSAEENPDDLDDVGKDTKTISRHTLSLGSQERQEHQTQEELDMEGETNMSYKEPPVYQIVPDNLTEVESEGKTEFKATKKIEPEREDYTEPENELSALAKDERTIYYNKTSEITDTKSVIQQNQTPKIEKVDECIQISPIIGSKDTPMKKNTKPDQNLQSDLN